MTYLVTYKFNNGPEEYMELVSLPPSRADLKLAIQRRRDSGIITRYNHIDEWHAKHARFIDIVSTKKL